MSPERLAAVYFKVKKGDPINQQELIQAIKAFKQQVNFLSLLRDKFFFSRRELSQVLAILEDFRRNREPRA